MATQLEDSLSAILLNRNVWLTANKSKGGCSILEDLLTKLCDQLNGTASEDPIFTAVYRKLLQNENIAFQCKYWQENIERINTHFYKEEETKVSKQLSQINLTDSPNKDEEDVS
jgi:hypothetical protein